MRQVVWLWLPLMLMMHRETLDAVARRWTAVVIFFGWVEEEIGKVLCRGHHYITVAAAADKRRMSTHLICDDEISLLIDGYWNREGRREGEDLATSRCRWRWWPSSSTVGAWLVDWWQWALIAVVVASHDEGDSWAKHCFWLIGVDWRSIESKETLLLLQLRWKMDRGGSTVTRILWGANKLCGIVYIVRRCTYGRVCWSCFMMCR